MGQITSQAASAPPPPPSCPVSHKTGQFPVSHDPPPAPSPPAAQCPVDHSTGGLNPLNQMPELSQAPSPTQQTALPTTRTASSIPRGDAHGHSPAYGDDGSTAEERRTPTWEYPSPQQFYNALARKGWETPEEHVETMVEIHNWLNERAWDEVLRWERRHDRAQEVQLARFQGRPGEMSPKARFWLFAGWLLPSRFNTEPPFDRHDWIVRRPRTGEEVRYVIDYYSAPPEPDGSPVFSLDVRPALDSVASIKERISVATEDMWAKMRENKQ